MQEWRIEQIIGNTLAIITIQTDNQEPTEAQDVGTELQARIQGILQAVSANALLRAAPPTYKGKAGRT